MPDPWAKAIPQDTPEEAEERKRYGGYTLAEVDEIASSPTLWARLHGNVEDEIQKRPVPFEPSALQLRMFGHYEHCQTLQIPCRMVVPKTRRGGGSTGAQAILYVHAHNYVSRLASIGTYEKVSMNLFSMAKFFNQHDTFKGWHRANKILETGEIKWPGKGKAEGSVWEKYTADNPESARSAGLSGYHASECGRWQEGGACDARETLQSMQGAVPRSGFTVIIEESTCQGAVGAFHNRFQSARWPTAAELGVAEGREYWRQWEKENPQNIEQSEAGRLLQFVRVFAAWFELDKNAQNVTPQDVEWLQRTQDDKEAELIAKYRTIGPQGPRLGSTAVKAGIWEQLAWRRAVIQSEFEGDVDAFSQENPASPAEGFAASGAHSFNRAGCAWMVEQSKIAVNNIPGILSRQDNGRVVFTQTDMRKAWLILHEDRKEMMRYLIALDTMGGKSNVKHADTADSNAGLALRAPYVDQDGRRHATAVVASLTPGNQMDPDVLAEHIHLMSDYFGGAMVAFERNNTGASFRDYAKDRGMNLYREVNVDKVTSQTTEILGWITDKESRVRLIGLLKKAIRCNADANTRHDGVHVWCPTLAKELQDMVVDHNNKDVAPPNHHDDFALALGIGLACLNGATLLKPFIRKRQDPPDLKSWRMR